MAAYITVQLSTNSFNVGDFNTALSGGSTKGQETLNNLIDIIRAIQSGTHSGTFSVSSSTVAGTVSGQTGGTAAFTIDLS